MKKKIVTMFFNIAAAIILTLYATPTMTVHAKMADQWVIDSVNEVKAGYLPEEILGGEILKDTITERQIIYVLDSGVCTEYIDQFKAAGLLSQDYGNAKSAQTAPVVSTESETPPVAETVPPAEIQVTEMTAVMYATQSVNLRNGNGVNFGKIGSLSKDQSVTVTGKAANGWYQIEWNGGKAYVSGKYLSEAVPSPEEMAVEAEVEPQTIPPETESISEEETLTGKTEETITAEEESTVVEQETEVETETEAVSKPDGVIFSWKIMGAVAGVVVAVACIGIVMILKGKKK